MGATQEQEDGAGSSPQRRRPQSVLPARPKSAMARVEKGLEYKNSSDGDRPVLSRPASASVRQRPTSAVPGDGRSSASGERRMRPASAMARNRIPRHMEAIMTAPASAIEEALEEVKYESARVKYESKFLDFVDPALLPTPKWIPALTDTDFSCRARRGGSTLIPRKDISTVENALAASSNGILAPSQSVSPKKMRGSSPARGRERDNKGVLGLWSSAAQKMLLKVFEAKCVDLKLKPLVERRERFLKTVRSQSTYETLFLADAGLGPLASAAVAAMLQTYRCPQLELSGNLLRDQGASAIAEMLATNRSLTKLDLRCCDIGVDGAARIFEALASNSTLTELDLGVPPVGGGSRNRVGLKAVKQLSSTLEINRTLRMISLNSNGMGAACSPTFAQGFAANTTLQSLDLSLNQLEDEGVVHFCKALETGGCLEQLNLSNNSISNRGASSIAQAIQKCQIMLQVLDLSYNKIGAKAATSLGQALSANSLLSTLQLDHNELGPMGGEGIAQGLLSKSLTTLTLGNNSLGDPGCQAIAKVLCSSPNIKKLDLSYNGVGDGGGSAVGAALAAQTSLTCLNLETNSLGDFAGATIAQALSQNTSLLTLSLKANLIHDATGSALVVGLRTNTSITELDVSWNDINYTNYNSIELMVQTQANIYQQASMRRMRQELERLKRMEPRLAIREVEFSDVTQQLERAKVETLRVVEERIDTAKMQADRLEEMSFMTKEGNAALDEKKALLAAGATALEDIKKEWKVKLDAVTKKKNLVIDEILHMKRTLEKARQEKSQEEADWEASEANYRERFQALVERKEQLQRELDQGQTFILKGREYEAAPFGDLVITITHAKGLKEVSEFDKYEAYCVITLVGTDYKYQTQTLVNVGEQALWNETVTWKDVYNGYANLRVQVWEVDEIKGEDLMGEGVLNLKEICSKAKKKKEKMKKRAAGLPAASHELIDVKDLAAWMKVNDPENLLNMTPQQVMAKYDSDGSGQLENEQMEGIRGWIEKEKLAKEGPENMRQSDTADQPQALSVFGMDSSYKVDLAKKGQKCQGHVRIKVQVVVGDYNDGEI